VYFVLKNLHFNKINISHNRKEEYLKIRATEMETKSSKLTILIFYRGPTGGFNQFIKNLDDALNHLYKPKE